MSKPVVRRLGIIDANLQNTVLVSWNGFRSYALRVVITDSKSNSVVWDNKVTTYYLSMAIPAGTLTNGNNYYVQAQTFDSSGKGSDLSDKVNFSTLATPSFSFSNIPDTITSSSFIASIHYYSPDLEPISSYTFYLYDTTRKQLLKSSTLYNQTDISYTYKGLATNTDYYVRCIGVTVSGLEMDTGYVRISVSLDTASEYARLYATNVPTQGCVQLSTNIVAVQYNGNETFSFEDGRINLVGKKLYYDEGFLVNNDFTLLLKGTRLWKNDRILTMYGQSAPDVTITLSTHIYSDETLRFNLKVFNGLSTYLIYSEPLVFTDQDEVTIGLRRKNNIYQIKTFLDTNVVESGDYLWGTNVNGIANEMDQWIDTEGEAEKYSKDTMRYFFDNVEPSEAVVGDLWISDSDLSAEITVEDVSTTETLEAYLASYSVTSDYLAGLNTQQMLRYLKWFNSFITAVKAQIPAPLLETFYKWSEAQCILINNWYTKNRWPSEVTSIIDEIIQNVDTILS